MEPAELSHRLREEVRRGFERATARWTAAEESDARFLARLPGRERGELSCRDYLVERVAPRLFAGAGPARAELAAALAERCPELAARLAADGERLRRHRVELLGFGTLDLGATIDWHRDPVTGATWERRFWTRYDLVGDPTPGDPKRVHELNRQQHLIRLAQAWWLLGDERCAREALAQMLGWIEQNPPGMGVNWHSSLEIALRCLTWMWTLALLAPASALDELAARRIVKSLFAQLEHVRRYPSLFSSPNTHLLGEAAALYVAGIAFGDCELGPGWLRVGAECLTTEIERQVDADGVHAELSPWYHAYALEFYLLAAVVAHRNSRELPAPMTAGLERMATALGDLCRPDGSLERLGDDDGGRALVLGAPDYRDPGDLLSTAAVLLGRGDCARRARTLRAETLWLLGGRAAAAFDRLPAAPLPEQRASYPRAGWFVQRSGAGADAHQLGFDCGGLGGLGGGHGHADALALTFAAGGRPLLVDPGTYVYGGEPGWRDYFRSTRAHNTATVDGRDQSAPGGTFGWRRQARARLLADRDFGDFALLDGEHDGYAGGPEGIVHRRQVLHVRPDGWWVIDRFAGAGEHRFEIFFHLPADATLSTLECTDDGREADLLAGSWGVGLRLFLHGSAPFDVEFVRGRTDPPQGWVSDRYGRKEPAPVIVARFRARAPAAFVTLLAPRRSGAGAGRGRRPVEPLAVVRRAAATGAPALALAAARGGREQLLVVPLADGETACGPLAGAGELFWGASEAGAVVRLLAVGARRATLAGRELIAGATPVTRDFEAAALGAAADSGELPNVRHRGTA